MKITESNAKKVIDMPDGRKLLLFGWETEKDEYPTSRNIYMMHNGDVVWRVRSDFDEDGGRFTNIWMEGCNIHAYRWDGGEYGINPDNGFATPLRLLK